MDILIRAICLLFGYLCGSFQTAYFYGKSKGIDIREHGSGNAGTTNSLRVLGKKAGAIVLLGDGLKCALAILAVKALLPDAYADDKMLYVMYVALGSILGHNFPFYLKFKGGKGIATTYGFLLGFDIRFFIVAFVIFWVIFLITNYVSLGSLIIYLCFFIQLILVGYGYMGGFGKMSSHSLMEIYIIGFIMTVMAFIRHKENIGRLVRGEERKTYLNKKNKLGGENG